MFITFNGIARNKLFFADLTYVVKIILLKVVVGFHRNLPVTCRYSGAFSYKFIFYPLESNDEQGSVEEARGMMSNLKDRMKGKLPNHCITEYNIPWAEHLDGRY